MGAGRCFRDEGTRGAGCAPSQGDPRKLNVPLVFERDVPPLGDPEESPLLGTVTWIEGDRDYSVAQLPGDLQAPQGWTSVRLTNLISTS